jgi:hypothetical protein
MVAERTKINEAVLDVPDGQGGTMPVTFRVYDDESGLCGGLVRVVLPRGRVYVATLWRASKDAPEVEIAVLP